MDLKVGEMHIGDGFMVRRVEDYGNAKDGQPWAFELRLYSASGHQEGVLLARTLMTESMFASVMAFLARRGEDAETHREALEFLTRP